MTQPYLMVMAKVIKTAQWCDKAQQTELQKGHSAALGFELHCCMLVGLLIFFTRCGYCDPGIFPINHLWFLMRITAFKVFQESLEHTNPPVLGQLFLSTYLLCILEVVTQIENSANS